MLLSLWPHNKTSNKNIVTENKMSPEVKTSLMMTDDYVYEVHT